MILSVKDRQVNSSVFAFHNNTTLVSCVPKKAKNVILLSTQHHNAEIHEDREDKKPEIIMEHNRTEACVDRFDQMIRTYRCQRKTRRWPMKFFQNLLDIAAFNAAVIFFYTNPEVDHGKPQRRRLFLHKLAMDMIAPAIQQRNPVRLQENPAPPITADGDVGNGGKRKRSRCNLCPRSVDKKTVEKCSACQKFLCKNHMRIVCDPDCM